MGDRLHSKRTLRLALQDLLALEILEGRIMDGDTVYVDLAPEGDRRVFSVLEGAPEPESEEGEIIEEG